MGLLFKSDFHDAFAAWLFAYILPGGADFGEIAAVGRAVGDGDDGAFCAAFTEAGERMAAEAQTVLAGGHRASARQLFLHAAAFHSVAYRPLFGAPADSRLLTAYRAQLTAFDRALALGDPSVERLSIRLGEASMPAYVIPAVGREGETGPLIIFTNGYDATVTDMYFASAVAASRRGYHCLLFDGPGQGAMLYEQGVPLRPDWEVVIGAVVDFALTQPIVDPARIALSGWSLGGHLAPRGASGEARIAALIADPGLWSVGGGFQAMALRMGIAPESAADLGEADQGVLDRLEAKIAIDRRLRWSVIQRGYWVHGVDNLRDYVRSADLFTMEGRAEAIACPTLFTLAEGDPLTASARGFFDALSCEKTLLRFTAAEGAGGHCEMQNRSMLNRRVLDWLDDRLGGAGG
jgi:dienelactone hydrolase